MRRLSAVAALSLLLTMPALGQAPPAPAPDGQRPRFQPPPDHWMTIDSLSQALNLTADQRAKIGPSYIALNGVLKDAAAKRQAFRQQMQGSGFQPRQEPTPEMRARFDSMGTKMDGFQAEADQWVAAIRNNLTPDQQTKFDALAKPQVTRRGGMGGAPPRP